MLQDKRFKNRELQIMKMMDHCNVVQLKHCFYSTTDKDEVRAGGLVRVMLMLQVARCAPCAPAGSEAVLCMPASWL